MGDGFLTKVVALFISAAVLALFFSLSPVLFALAFGPFLLMAILIMVVQGPRELLGEFWDRLNRSTRL
jgi:hypothetical protein